MADINQIKRIFEAALFGAGQPLALPQLAALFEEQDMPTHEDIARALEELKTDSEGRGVELVEVASGFRYQVREDVHPFVSRLWTERQTRYSRALLETLALIAYRQPITRAEIEQIRGVGVASSIVKTLEEREWVRVVGYRDLPGKPALFGTTKAFLDYFNLKSLDQLPPLSEIRDIEDIDPQLSLDGPETPRAPDEPDADSGEGTDTHGDTPHPGQHAPAPTTDEDAHAEHKMRDDTPEPAA
jgi:segregation and condensation protein B